MTDIPLACDCGEFQAVVHEVSPKTCNHVICYCVDCQAFARHLQQEERVLDQQGGTDLYQVQPFQVQISSGADQLSVLRLSPKGAYRWFAKCCGTPICNTLGTPKVSFVGFLVANMQPPLDVLGPVQLRYKPDQALTPVTDPSGSVLWLVMKTAWRGLRSRLNGKWRQTPFFDVETGRAIAKPHVLTDEEREAAYGG